MRLCVVPSEIWVLLQNGRLQRTSCVHQVLLQTRQTFHKNLQNITTFSQKRNNKLNSNIGLVFQVQRKSKIVNVAEYSEYPSIIKVDKNVVWIKELHENRSPSMTWLMRWKFNSDYATEFWHKISMQETVQNVCLVCRSKGKALSCLHLQGYSETNNFQGRFFYFSKIQAANEGRNIMTPSWFKSSVQKTLQILYQTELFNWGSME